MTYGVAIGPQGSLPTIYDMVEVQAASVADLLDLLVVPLNGMPLSLKLHNLLESGWETLTRLCGTF